MSSLVLRSRSGSENETNEYDKVNVYLEPTPRELLYCASFIMAAEAELGVMDIGLRERAQKRMEKKKRRLKEAEVGF